MEYESVTQNILFPIESICRMLSNFNIYAFKFYVRCPIQSMSSRAFSVQNNINVFSISLTNVG
jgi:hypothetical protein